MDPRQRNRRSGPGRSSPRYPYPPQEMASRAGYMGRTAFRGRNIYRGGRGMPQHITGGWRGGGQQNQVRRRNPYQFLMVHFKPLQWCNRFELLSRYIASCIAFTRQTAVMYPSNLRSFRYTVVLARAFRMRNALGFGKLARFRIVTLGSE